MDETKLKMFSWSDAQDQLTNSLPTWTSCVGAALTAKGNSETSHICARTGVISSLMLHTIAPWRYKFIQACMAIELWCQGASHKLFTCLNHLGLSLGVNASRSYVDDLSTKHDQKVKGWKAMIENDKVHNGFSLCTDNVQISIEAKHQNSEASNAFRIWSLTFAVENRVPTLQYDDCAVVAARTIPLNKLLPDQQDWLALRSRMKVCVRAALVDYIPWLEELQAVVTRVVPHKYTALLNKQSTIVNTGLVEGNPSSTDGMIQVMDHLQTYVPQKGGPVSLMASGDGATVISMARAKKAVANGLQGQGCQRFRGLAETPQEFHKQGIILQDFMNNFYSGASQAERGTLSNLKEVFNHRNVKTKVMAAYQHVWDFIQFSTVSYLVLLAMHLAGTADLNQKANSYPEALSEKLAWLDNLSNQVVSFCWLPYEAKDLREVQEGFTESEGDICVCLEDKDEDIVQCSSRMCLTSHYHLSCAWDYVPGQRWFCSQDCQKAGTCWCGEERDSEMLECGAGSKCKGNTLYHVACVNSPKHDQGKWYCSEACSLGVDDTLDDGILQYSKGLIWSGLNAMVRHNAVRQGDGPAMVSDWKKDMLSFWSYGHTTYFRIGHQFLTNVGGFVPKRLQEDMVWNRVANLGGSAGRNIGLDLVNEFLNNDFKEMLKRSHGVYTPKQIERCSNMSGAYGKEIGEILSDAMLHRTEPPGQARKKVVLAKDVVRFTQLYAKDGLLSYVPGRHYKGVAAPEMILKKPRGMGEKLFSFSKDLDKWKELLEIPDES